MSEPVLRALTESGGIWDDPSEDLLYELLGDVERGDETWLIVERLADTSGQTYTQVIRSDNGSWTVERREGGPDRHYATTVDELRV